MANLNNNQVNIVLDFIKKNKKYSSISDGIIKEEIIRYFNINPQSIKFIEKTKSEKFKDIVKSVRAKLHLIYGSFQAEDKSKRESYLKELKAYDDYETHDRILSTSVSAKERLNNYKTIYQKIFSTTGKPETVLDLGCGLNPVSYPYMGIDKLMYYAYDIDKEDINFLNKYFDLIKKYSKLKGKASMINLADLSAVKNLPKADICFMFKLIDPLEAGKGHKLSEEIIKLLDCRYIVISFSTKTVSGKPMNYPYRGWIEMMLTRINLKFDKILTENEVFYIISK